MLWVGCRCLSALRICGWILLWKPQFFPTFLMVFKYSEIHYQEFTLPLVWTECNHRHVCCWVLPPNILVCFLKRAGETKTYSQNEMACSWPANHQLSPQRPLVPLIIPSIQEYQRVSKCLLKVSCGGERQGWHRWRWKPFELGFFKLKKFSYIKAFKASSISTKISLL